MHLHSRPAENQAPQGKGLLSRSLIFHLAFIGLALFVLGWVFDVINLDISFWWWVLAIGAATHIGLILLGVAGLLCWVAHCRRNRTLKSLPETGEAKDLNFGYSWLWTYGHLIPTGLFLGAIAITGTIGASTWIIVVLGILAAWSFAGFLVARFLFRINDPGNVPTCDFLSDGTGRVLDLGCGSGRTSIMVARARPKAEIVAVDNFSADYIAGHSRENTACNFEIAGVSRQITIREGDMCKLPFDDQLFDAAVSCAAIDHLSKDIPTALSEAYRVLRTDGELLLILIVPNLWIAIMYGPLPWWGGAFASRRDWRLMLDQVGFSLTGEGSIRGCAWITARKRASEVAVDRTAGQTPDVC